MAYMSTFHTIARMFNLAMGLSNSKWNDNIYEWNKKYPTCVTKKIGKLSCIHFMKLWDGERLPPINTVSIYSL
ncbi:hypothetical protein BDA96_10G295200 [Sorghum bicolor]|uniref:Uncharacterized protein n=1 Tax=Sorghum bicolor TaxID=4558 RepID=A0A921Q808_SORBI|nr:hypothetical protein BDA96_10G295200 [Sorghum bicolor]